MKWISTSSFMRLDGLRSGSLRRLITALAAIAVAVAVLAPGSAQAVDVDGNGTHDMLVREGRFYPRTAGGDCVASYRTDGGVRRQVVTFSVRPPAVFPLWRLAIQRVAWRANFFQADNGALLASSPWEYARTVPNGTVFGGWPSLRAMIGTRQYLAGSHTYEHDPTVSVRASVEVAWLNGNTGRWVTASAWVNDMTVRTFGGARLPFLGGIGGDLVAVGLLQRNMQRC